LLSVVSELYLILGCNTLYIYVGDFLNLQIQVNWKWDS